MILIKLIPENVARMSTSPAPSSKPAVFATVDPLGKIPVFKYCAIAVKAGGQLAQALGFFQESA